MSWQTKLKTDGVSFDVETHVIQPGLLAPPLVCGSFHSGISPKLLTKVATLNEIERLLDEGKTIIGANIAYDFAVVIAARPRLLRKVWQAYEQSRVFDILLAETLNAIAGGHVGKYPNGAPIFDSRGRVTQSYSLYSCVKSCLGRDTAKANDKYRLRYSEFDGVPISEWPYEAQQYPKDDAVNTYEVAIVQSVRYENLHDMQRQALAAFCLHLGGVWGLQCDPKSVADLEETLKIQHDSESQHFKDLGFVRVDGTCDTIHVKRLVAKAYGATKSCVQCVGTGFVAGHGWSKPTRKTPKRKRCEDCEGTGFDIQDVSAVPLTESGKISTSRDALNESCDDDLIAYASYKEADKLTSTYLPFLKSGISQDGKRIPITLSANPLLETGRNSYRGVIQLLPRKGGIRECFEARQGKLFLASDYSGIELVTHAQNCLWVVGFSKLAELINAGVDVHSRVASEFVGLPYSEFVARKEEPAMKSYRQAAKPANFGFPGGMGELTLVGQQRASGPDTTGPDGRKYKGLRFCILMGRAQVCGIDKLMEYKNAPIAPTCAVCIECAKDLREAWFKAFPENREYFKRVAEWESVGYITQHVTKRKRAGISFCAAANSMFQGLASDGMKNAMIAVTKETLFTKGPLTGSRFVLAVHDELILEVPANMGHEASERLQAIMKDEMRKLTPDLKVETEAVLMKRWSKSAKPKHVDGRLVAYDAD